MAIKTKVHTRIDARFEALAASGKKAFIPYITAGDPDLEGTEDIIYRLEDAGADIIELGVPFSDPVADGTTNQLAAERGLASGTSLKKILDMVARVRTRSEVPLMLFTYMNPLYARGFDRAVAQAAKAGIDGCLLVDISMEESTPFREALAAHNLNNIVLLTPTSPVGRIKEILKTGTGFAYCVSRTGVTGEQSEMQQEASKLLQVTTRHSKIPVALGFGVSTPGQARNYAKMADAVVVGSFIVTTYFKAGNTAKGRAAATRKIKKLIDAVKEV